MKRFRKAFVVGAVAAIVSLTAACSGGSGGASSSSGNKTLTIGYASCCESNSFVATVTQGLRADAKKAGYKLTVLDNANDAAKSVTNAQQIATLKPDVFIEYNGFADSNSRIDRIMKQAGVPVLAVQYPVADAPLVAIDNKAVGEAGGKAVAEAAAKKWGANTPVDALMLADPQGGAPQLDRRNGAIAGIKSVLPGVKVTNADDKNDASIGRQITSDYLTAHPHNKIVIWTHIDSVAVGIAAAARSAGRTNDVLAVSTGGDAVIFPEIRRKNSPIVGTVGLFPELWGTQMLKAAVAVADGKKIASPVRPGKLELIDAANVDKLYPGK